VSAGEIAFAILTGLAINECCDLSPWAARKLICWSAHRRYEDPGRAETRAEELARLIDDCPGKLFKLVTALAFVAYAIADCVRRALARNMPDRIVQFMKKLTWRVRAPLPPLLTDARLVLLDTSSYGVEAIETLQGNSFVNDLECEWVLAACKRINEELPRQPGRRVTVSVLTYYRGQANALLQRLNAHRSEFPAFRFQVVGTIDAAQGCESDFVVASFCRSWPARGPNFGGFLKVPGVLLTRSRSSLILVGNLQTLSQVHLPTGGLIDLLQSGANVRVLRDLRSLES
jgi:hypothetical protein